MKQYKGIIYIIISAFCFALMNVFVRLAGELPSVQKSFFRNFVAFLFAAAIMMRRQISVRCGAGNFRYLLLRSVFGTLGILCNFYAVDHLVLADASMLNKMSPFFAIIFSYLILKKKSNSGAGTRSGGAFIGSLFIIRPTLLNMDLIPSLIGLLGGIGAGAAYTMVRLLGSAVRRTENRVYIFRVFLSCHTAVPDL